MVDQEFKNAVDELQADVNKRFGSSMEGVWMLPLQCMYVGVHLRVAADTFTGQTIRALSKNTSTSI